MIDRSNGYTVPNVISGSGTLTKSGSGYTRLTGNNTYAGTTTINAGYLNVGFDGPTGTLGSGSVVNNTYLVFRRTNAMTVDNDISGTGQVTQNAGGTVTMTGTCSYGGTTVVKDGALRINGNSLGVTSAMTVWAGAKFGGRGSYGGDITMQNGAGLSFEFHSAGNTLNCAGTLDIGSGVLGFNDFTHEIESGHQPEGFQVLVSAASITGTLDAGNLTGTINGKASVLSVSGSDLIVFVPGASMFLFK